MQHHDLSRRSLWQAITTMLGAVTLPGGSADITQAAHEAHASAQLARGVELSFFAAAEAADVEAIAAQITPTDARARRPRGRRRCTSSTAR